MNTYTDKEINKIMWLSALGFSIALALLFTIVPALEKQTKINNQLEDKIEKLEEDYKIYEINLNNLENNKEVQLEVE